jgi:eukaryotic-like serine/threonine-protein kinase
MMKGPAHRGARGVAPMNEESVFLEALQVPTPEERAAFLDRVCAGNPDLRRGVQMLLRAHEKADRFMQTAPCPGSTADERATERPGTVIGPYKLLQQIGEGGMGTVFMAEQTRPVRRRVALKVIKAGMDSRQVIARFEGERQALAMMDHVNIARVLDAGTTDAGLPYFVMELVHGVPITKYCDDNRLTPRERLELFVPVCQAIQHAHQKGIIHRDIKPSNVMVTLYDGKPVPKVIDFGVAKAIEQKLTERTLFTQYGTMVGTFEYMSPEQAEMSALGADTRSDIYSLGVLLYELLTGSTPLTRKRVKEAAYGEILRMIKEEEAPKPSTRLSDSGEALASISAQRHMEPAKLTKLVRGELDWIVMKMLEKDRNRRYETANGLAADVQRYLADDPVQACPPSAWYRFRKFARRNKAALVATMLIAIALVAGTIVSTWQAIRATKAEALAQDRLVAEQEQRALTQKNAADANARRQEAEAARKEAIANLQKAREAVDQMLTRVSEDKLLNTPQMEPLRKALLQDALRFYQEFLKQKATDPQSRLGTGEAWRRIGDLQTVLAEYAQAEAAFREAIAILEPLLQEFPDDSEHLSALARAFGGVAALYLWHLPDHAKAAPAIKRSEELQAELVRRHPDNLGNQAWLGWTQLQRAALFYGTDKAVEAARRAATISDRLTAEHPDNPGYRRLHATAYYRLGEQLHASGQSREAEQAYRRALTFKEASSGAFGFRAEMLVGLAMTMFDTGRDAEVEKICREAEAHALQMAKDYPKTMHHQYGLVLVQCRLGQVLERQKRKQEAEQVYRQAAATARKAVSEAPTMGSYGLIQFTDSHDRLLNLLTDDDRLPAAIEVCRDAIAVCEQLVTGRADQQFGRFGLVQYRMRLAALLRRSGGDKGTHQEEVQRLARLALDDLDAMLRDPSDVATRTRVGGLANNFAWQLTAAPAVRVRDADFAVELAKKAVAAEPQRASFQNTLGVALYRARDWKAAVAALEKSMELRKGGDSFDWFVLAMAHWQLGNKGDAHKWYDQAVQWMDKNQPKNEELRYFRTEATELLGIEKKKD